MQNDGAAEQRQAAANFADRQRVRQIVATALFLMAMVTLGAFDATPLPRLTAAQRQRRPNASEVVRQAALSRQRVSAMDARMAGCAQPMARNISGRYFGSWRISAQSPTTTTTTGPQAGWFDDSGAASRGTPRVDGAASWESLSADCRTEAITAVMRHLGGREDFPALGAYPVDGAAGYSSLPGSLFGSPLKTKLTQSIGAVDVVVEQPTSGEVAFDLVEQPTALSGVTRITGFVQLEREVSIIIVRRKQSEQTFERSGSASNARSVTNKTVTVDIPVFGFYFRASGVLRLLSAPSYIDADLSLPASGPSCAEDVTESSSATAKTGTGTGTQHSNIGANGTATSDLHAALLRSMRDHHHPRDGATKKLTTPDSDVLDAWWKRTSSEFSASSAAPTTRAAVNSSSSSTRVGSTNATDVASRSRRRHRRRAEDDATSAVSSHAAAVASAALFVAGAKNDGTPAFHQVPQQQQQQQRSAQTQQRGTRARPACRTNVKRRRKNAIFISPMPEREPAALAADEVENAARLNGSRRGRNQNRNREHRMSVFASDLALSSRVDKEMKGERVKRRQSRAPPPKDRASKKGEKKDTMASLKNDRTRQEKRWSLGSLSRCYLDLTLRATFNAVDGDGDGDGGAQGRSEVMSSEPFGTRPYRVDLRGVSHSMRCPDGELDLSVSSLHVEDDVLWWKSVRYTFLVFAVCVVQCVLLVRQMSLAGTQSYAAKMSVASLGAQALLDSYMCLGHIMLGIWPRSLARWSISPLIIGSFAKLVIFSIFEMRLLLIVWKSQRPDAFNNGWATMRRELMVLYSRFYCVLLLGIAVMFQMSNWIGYLAIPAALIWVPQIYMNAMKCSVGLDTVHVVGMSLSRLAIPLYFLVWPENLLSLLLRTELRPRSLSSCYAFGGRNCLPPSSELGIADVAANGGIASFGSAGIFRAVSDVSGLDGIDGLTTSTASLLSTAAGATAGQQQAAALLRLQGEQRRLEAWFAGERGGPTGPKFWLAVGVVGTIFVQMLLLIGQRYFGPRWFVPSLLLPKPYVYHRKVPEAASASGSAAAAGGGGGGGGGAAAAGGDSAVNMCVICMASIDGSMSSDDEGSQSSRESSPRAARARRGSIDHSTMVTPCDHQFHSTCLLQWMEIRMQCPTCRAELPAVQCATCSARHVE